MKNLLLPIMFLPGVLLAQDTKISNLSGRSTPFATSDVMPWAIPGVSNYKMTWNDLTNDVLAGMASQVYASGITNPLGSAAWKATGFFDVAGAGTSAAQAATNAGGILQIVTNATPLNASITGTAGGVAASNVTSGGVLPAGTVSATSLTPGYALGNDGSTRIWTNLLNGVSIGGNAATVTTITSAQVTNALPAILTNAISTSGNITGAVFYGSASGLTGLPSSGAPLNGTNAWSGTNTWTQPMQVSNVIQLIGSSAVSSSPVFIGATNYQSTNYGLVFSTTGTNQVKVPQVAFNLNDLSGSYPITTGFQINYGFPNGGGINSSGTYFLVNAGGVILFQIGGQTITLGKATATAAIYPQYDNNTSIGSVANRYINGYFVGTTIAGGNVSCSTITATNGFGVLKTNAAPSNVTLGVTAPDSWVCFTNTAGVQLFMPAWTNH